MTRRALLVLLLLLTLALAPVPTARDESPVTLYLPMTMRMRHAALCLEAVPGAMAAHKTNLIAIGPNCFRSNFGSQADPYYGPYQRYLAGGWEAVDAQMLPELALWAEIGADPLIIFIRGGNCQVPSLSQLRAYGNFIVEAVERYDLPRFEVWNEPDAAGGYPSLFGCFGTAHADRLIYLLDWVQARVPSYRQVGVSYMVLSQEHMDFLLTTAPHADWIGIHHYGIWSNGIVQEPCCLGSVMDKYSMASAAGVPVWVTEYNLRSPNEADYGEEHQTAQMEYVMDALDNLQVPMISILVYYKYPDWQGTGIRTTQLEAKLMGYPAP